MAPSANIGRVIWPENTKTQKTNEMAMKDPSSGFELSCMYSRYRRQALALQMLGADDVCSERFAWSNGPAAPPGGRFSPTPFRYRTGWSFRPRNTPRLHSSFAPRCD